ncbi:structural maintenance of chromosomes protein 1A [Lutzomyia longipalpis]|uniref:structural maintenance of chromosomes protein 1A n=1 Tax=Lutzomyia longipalpis TaxID=7200 RepID=UPI002483E43B|nr:structural maintenance of chromosomes protein 1A [Lutzomyia longipalpis]
MSAFLEFIEMDNFKSYKGNVCIGPLKEFTAVIGPNGSGKSNFMDAISFVMGEKTSNVNSGKYTIELENLGINVKARNFLVFQGAVESIAMKNAKERTTLFEEISGSGALKDDYNRTKQEMQIAEEETQYTYQKKKGIAAERKEARLEKLEADRYAKIKEEYANLQVIYNLFRLHHCEKDIERLNEEMEIKQQEIQNVEQRKEQADEVLKDKKKEAGKIARELAKVDQDIREVETNMSKKHPVFIKAKEKVAHTQNKLDSARKTLDQANRADQAHQADIEKLEGELAAIEAKKKQFEQEVAGESRKRGINLNLGDGQVQEYDRLKQKADATAAKYLSKLDSVNREQKSDQDLLDNEYNKKSNIDEQVKTFMLEREEVEKRTSKLRDHIESSKLALEEQNRIKHELKTDVGSSKDRIAELHRELEDVREQLGDAKVDKHEDARRRKKEEVVELFKKEVPGVYDRMINMCQPIHKRYNVAVTKVLGKYMEAIIVDTEKTARRCIQILKEQMLEVETFLPLDYLQAKPLKDRLRNINEPRNVKLVYDVLKFEPPQIERAVLFATNNALVCETPEDAMKVAYEMDRSRYDALALDGTFYQKSGIISGGSHDLARKAKRWDDKHMAQLKAQKEKLNEEMKELMKKSRKQGELTTVESQIKGLENRLKYSQNDLEASIKSMKEYDRKLKNLQDELNSIDPKINDIERRMNARNKNIQDIKESMNSVEDKVYADFCRRIGVTNIRQYEERELVMQQERAKKLADFEQQIDKIMTHLDFERSKDTKKNVQRWERTVQDEEDALETFQQAESRYRSEIETDKQRIDQLKQEKQNKKTQVDQMESETAKARRDVAALAKELHTLGTQLSGIEAKIETKKNDRHSILIQCKMDDIIIPMLNGTMNDIVQPGQDGDSESINSSTIYARESNLKIDYDLLRRDQREAKSADAVKKKHDELQKELQSKQDLLESIQTPNLKAMQKLDMVSEKVASTNEEFENARKKTKKAKTAFERVKNDRTNKFTHCFSHISDAIDGIYKALARNEAAQAYLGPDNPEEPYLGGINYNCVAPGKRFQAMANLSGGEKTIAALALLFAIHSYQPAPFFVLDEIDAALDNTNIGKVASYIREKTQNLQTIVISLKEEFYAHADLLIGICPDAGDCLISRVYSFDLKSFEVRDM